VLDPMAHLLYYCERCQLTVTIYRGDPIAIPFGRLPQAVAEVIDHDCKEQK